VTDTRALIRCDGASVPAAVAAADWSVRKEISSRGPAPSLNLRAQNLAGTVLTAVGSHAADLVRIAAYIYAADQDLSRGGPADVYGHAWRRQIALCMPVGDPDFWQQGHVREALASVLSFLTEDRWEFHFSLAAPEIRQINLDVDEPALLRAPDSVVLLSGGADSLCTAVEAIIGRGERPVLVSHRPAPHLDARQRALTGALRDRFPQWAFPQLSFWVHHRGADPTETSQRSRAFLFASLGAAVAAELGIGRVLLGDNGIVSLNLPFSGQLVGALASRSTHPNFLRLFNHFVAAVLPQPAQVENPLLFRTRAEVLAILAEAGCPDLLQETNSCSRGRARPAATPHCGYCSQCVDRRFGAIAAGLEEHDLAERYGLDIFTQPLPEGEARTVAESYVRFARQLQGIGDEQLFAAYPQLYDCLDPRDPALDDTARQLTALLQRHARGVLAVVATMVARHSERLAGGTLPEGSLIRLAIGGATREPAADTEEAKTFRRVGQAWEVAFRGQVAHIRHATGLVYIARLLGHPGHEFRAADLAAGLSAPSGISTAELTDAGLHPPGAGAADAVLDPQAKTEYRRRVDELQADLREAETAGDSARAARIEKEMAAIEHELRAATGRGGRSRAFRGADDKAREAVSKAIHRSLRTIETYHPPLGRHLRGALTIGFRCSYAPDPPIIWHT